MLKIIKDRLLELGYPVLLGFQNTKPSLVIDDVYSRHNVRSIHIIQTDDELTIHLFDTTGLATTHFLYLSNPTSIQKLEQMIHNHFRTR